MNNHLLLIGEVWLEIKTIGSFSYKAKKSNKGKLEIINGKFEIPLQNMFVHYIYQ